MNIHLSDEKAMLGFAAQIAKAVDDGLVLFLEGPLGAGKTTFTRGFLRGLGFTEKVKSPTYALVEPYHLPAHDVFHFDFYRLQDAKELAEMGIEEYFTPASICLIEWPAKGQPYLPEPDIMLVISIADTGRAIYLKALSARGKRIIEKL